MQLAGGDELRGVLDALERVTSGVNELAGFSVDVIAVSDFSRFQQLTNLTAHGRTPALFVRSERRIYVQLSVFGTYGELAQLGVLLHEIAHAWLHLAGKSQATLECIEADLMVCRWGFVQEAVAARATDSVEMSVALQRYQSDGEAAARQAIEHVAMMRLAGL